MARITQNAAARTARAVLLFAGCLALGVLCGLSSTSEGNLRQQRVSNQEQSRQQQQKQEPSHMPDADLFSGAGRPVAGRNLDEDGADYVWEGDFAASQFASVLQEEEASAPAHIEGLDVPDQALAGAMSLSFDFKDDLSFSFSYDF